MTDIFTSSTTGVDNNQDVGTLNITFFTKVEFPLKVPDTNFAIPANTTPQGLNALINELFSISFQDLSKTNNNNKSSSYQAQPFDFLIDDEFVCVPMDKFLRRRGISAEGVLKVEFVPAMRAQEGSKLPHDDWVAAVTCPIAGHAEQCFVTASYDRLVRIWQDESCVANGVSHIDAVKSVAFRPGSVKINSDGSMSAAGGNRRQRTGAANSNSSNAVLPDGSSFEFVSGGKDGTIRLWKYDAPSKLSCLGFVKAHVNGVDSVAVSPDGSTIASASWDTTVKIWDLASINGSKTSQSAASIAPQLTFADHTRPALATAFTSRQNNKLCSTGLDGTVKLYDLEKGQVESTGPATHAAQCLDVRTDSSNNTGAGAGNLILTGHTDSRIRLFDTRANRIASAWSGHRQWIYSVCWLQRDDDPSPMANAAAGNPLIASASEDATVRVWDMRSTYGALMTFDKIHNDGVLGVTYGGAGTVVSCGKDNRTKTVQVMKGQGQ